MSRIRVILLRAILVVTLGVPPVPAAAQGNSDPATVVPPVARAVRLTVLPVVDGRLDDEAWEAVDAFSEFRQHEPLEGTPPSERTEIRVGYDDEAVYIAARMLDHDPAGILFGENRRDANLQDADALLIVLDTYLDRQNAFVFGTTPAGIEYDGQVTRDGQGGLSTVRRQQEGGSGGGFNLNWDGSWEVATAVDADGWTAEFRIPFSTLRYRGGGAQAWGLNISRSVRRRNEEDFWAPVPRQHTLYRVSQAGTLEGVEAPVRRTGSVTPYGLGGVQRDFVAGTEIGWSGEIGGDAKLVPVPNVTIDLTYNTDFAQVEADEQQVNLTRFSLFFPEKRPFFLENAGLFSVGTPRAGSDLGMDLFYSRRIGIADGGTPVPILGGARVTGRVAGLAVGAFDLQTERVEPDGIVPNNYAAGRVLRELPNRSQIGALAVGRLNTDSTPDHNLTFAVDGRWGIGESVNFDAYLARTVTPGATGRQHGLGVNGGYQTRDWDAGVQYREVGEGFNPEVGFVNRRGYRAIIGRLQRNVRVPGVAWIRELRPHALARGFYGFDGMLETRYVHLDNAVAFESGAFLSTAVNIQREALRDSFEIADGVVLPAGSYDFVEGVVRFNTNASATWSASGTITVGTFYSGHHAGASGEVMNRVGATWVGALRLGRDVVELAEGSFTASLVGLRVAWSFTPRVFLQALTQYNSQSDRISANVRFGWLTTAGTGLFLVYNDEQRTGDPRGAVGRAFIIKYTRQFDIAW